LHEEHRAKPGAAETIRRTGRVFQAGTQRRSLPNFVFAIDLARRGKLGKTPHTPCPTVWVKNVYEWLAPAETPPGPGAGGLGHVSRPAAWRPYNKALLDGFNFEKAAPVGGGCLEWGSIRDLCQWANDADNTEPVEYEPAGKELHARYENGVKLVLRDDGWLKLGSCPVRFEARRAGSRLRMTEIWSPARRRYCVGKGAKISGYRLTFMCATFSTASNRGPTRADADAMCHAHIACHAANIALFLDRRFNTIPVKNDSSTTNRPTASVPRACANPGGFETAAFATTSMKSPKSEL